MLDYLWTFLRTFPPFDDEMLFPSSHSVQSISTTIFRRKTKATTTHDTKEVSSTLYHRQHLISIVIGAFSEQLDAVDIHVFNRVTSKETIFCYRMTLDSASFLSYFYYPFYSLVYIHSPVALSKGRKWNDSLSCHFFYGETGQWDGVKGGMKECSRLLSLSFTTWLGKNNLVRRENVFSLHAFSLYELFVPTHTLVIFSFHITPVFIHLGKWGTFRHSLNE